MTKEESYEILKNSECFGAVELYKKDEIEAFYVALEALKAKPCEDATGKWEEFDHGMGIIFLKCPFCGEFQSKADNHNFCSSCGAKLEVKNEQ